MKSQQVAARFAAYVWYTSSREAPRRVVRKEARKFAEKYWRSFLPVAPAGLGKLLLRVAGSRRRSAGVPSRTVHDTAEQMIPC
jgi:hypothetical protein